MSIKVKHLVVLVKGMKILFSFNTEYDKALKFTEQYGFLDFLFANFRSSVTVVTKIKLVI